ncbi:unnamed protein product [Mytilus edulis]|uniref:Mutator-like transposase domain-containing protein n=1 Tax=Mytilus edulis TaxID=6550 RepID=A0A8S3SXP4_MYTED|nr:unnamed protein product [Mytilus edulis]
MSFLARLKVYKTTSNEIIGKIDRRIVCQSNVVFLMFRAPLLLLAGTCYTLQLFMEGRECVQGSVGAEIRQCSNVDGDQNIITFREPFSGKTTVNGGLTDSGLGARQFSKLVTTMGIPGITAKTIKRREREIKIPIYDVAKDSCLRVIEEEIECMRLSNSCSHIGALLFKIDLAVKMGYTKITCTEEP